MMDSKKPSASGKCFLILFGMIFSLFGLVALKPMLITPLQKIRAAKTWNPVSATVVSSKVKSHLSDATTTYSPYIAYRYEVNGEDYLGDQYSFMGGSSSGYEGKATLIRQYPKDHAFTLYVNPGNPTESVIQREGSKKLFFGLVPLLFVFIGVAVIIAGIRAKKATLDYGRAKEHIVTLKGSSPIGKAIGLLVFTLIWSGAVFALFKSDAPLFFTGIFGFFDLIVAAASIHAVLAIFNPRPIVEITPGDIHPGTSIALRWKIEGRTKRIEKLSLSLQCLRMTTETSGHGKNRNTRIVKTPIFNNELLTTDRQNEIIHGTLQFSIPKEEPSSVPGNNGGICWQLIFHGDIPRWPDLKKELTFLVYPETSCIK